MAPSAAPCARALTRALLASTALVGVGLPLGPGPLRAEPLPRGGQVISGGVTIGTPQGGALAITQSSQTAIVNWQGFSVGQGHRVDIRQPSANAALLNRVTGATPSTIAGQLNATGQVYLVNPNGVTITRSGQVNAAGFVASSLGISDEDFKGGRRHFRGSGASAPVTNHGAITIGRGGYAALIGGSVSNTGTISVPMGRVGLGAGERATLDLSGDGFLQVAVPTRGRGRGALVAHSGTIAADGGSVTLSAAAARDMARQAVNLSGTVEARSVSGTNGRITLSGGEGRVVVGPAARLDASGAGAEAGGRVRVAGRRLDVAGTVDVSGATGGRARLKASEHLALSGRLLAEGRTGRGGRVVATAPEIATQAARIEASGAAGGGVVRLGGGRMGQGPLAQAERVSVDAASVIRADATRAGVGGDVVVWSDGATRFSGTITARGGAAGGDGGQAEVSSKGVLSYEGRTDLTAAKGAFGTLLLDPYDVTITSGAHSTGGGFTATANGSVINATTLLTALGSANVTVSTGSGGGQAGAITLAASTPLAWNTGATLTLQAAGAVTLNSAVTAPAGGLTIAAEGGTSTATAGISVARFTLALGDWVQNTATLPGFAAGDFQVDGGSFLRAAGGAGTSASPYRLTDIYGVQGMGTSSPYQAASYQLAGDVDASGTVAWNGGAGFNPVGTFTGSLDGAGYAITGLTIARPSQDYVGLFGYVGSGGRVGNLGLVGGSVSGYDFVGALVGYNYAGTVSQSYATGTVSGSGNSVGGLVGYNDRGTVSRSYATGRVSGSFDVGGLVGTLTTGTVSQSYATGTVSGSGSYAGGLVGFNDRGTVSQSYATGTVSGPSSVGGLVGLNNIGTVSQSYAAGSVSGSSAVGGLAGHNGGTLTNTYWDTDSTGRMSGVGSGSSTGATGLTTAQARAASNYGGFDFSTVWYQAGDLRPILRSEAAPAVGGVSAVSNLHQLQLIGANLAGRYWLTANIDAVATSTTAASSGIWGTGGFVPVGESSSNPFTGSLDGAGYTITGLTITRPSQSYVGLFGIIGSGGRVGDFGLVGGSVSGNSAVGGLVGQNGGTVIRSYATGSVTGGANAPSVGGLVGVNAGGTVAQSYATGSVSGSGDYVGGLVGRNSGTISQSYATGSVKGPFYVGGLVGHDSGTVSEVYATGRVTGSSFVGGLFGLSISALTNAYWDTNSTGMTSSGAGSSPGTTGLTTAQARVASNYGGFDFSTVWYQAGDMRPILRSEAAQADTNGVVAVSNLHQLQLMGANLAGRYRLTANIDAVATSTTAASSGIWGSGGFVPVGESTSNPFTGSLDGAGRTITGLTISRPSQDLAGLIGALGAGGRISGLGLVGDSVSGTSNVGGLVGTNAGSISQSYATGAASGSSAVGGLIGTNAGSISRSYATGAVSGSGAVGGLVGVNNGTISQSYAADSVFGITLVGVNGSRITQAYAAGDVSGSNTVGGLVGHNGNIISESYATGAVSGNTIAGGLVGRSTGGTLTSTYWNTATARQRDGVGNGPAADAIGLTTAQMQDLASFRANYAGFDFATVWAPPNQAGQGGLGSAFYPQLYGVSNVVAVTPSSSRTYGSGSAPVATYAGLRPSDFVTMLGTLSTGATASSDVGNYAVTASGAAVTGAAGTAYRVVYATGTLSITPATITVAGATGVDKTYDRSSVLPGGTPGFTSAGVLFGDAVTVSAGSAAYDSARAGTHSVIVSGLSLSGAKAGNYRLSAASVTGSGTIDPAALTVAGVRALDKTYDGTTAALLAGTASVTALSGDVVSVSGTGTGTFADKNAGTGKAVTVGGYSLAGIDAGNYTLVQPSGLSADIARANLAVSGLSALDKTYDGTTAAALAGTATVTPIGADLVALTGAITGRFARQNAGPGSR
jgi:filamentous hemagglutinin family protein